MVSSPTRLLVAASGTGGHLFPAIATAEQLSDYEIEWLGVPDRLETQLVPQTYRLHTIRVGGFQQRLGLGSVRLFAQLSRAIFQVRQLLLQGKFQGVFTTGGYISAPAIIAARSLGLPAILHESNALPGKVTRWLSPWCTKVALGFDTASSLLPRTSSVCVGTPVRSQFLQPAATPEAFAIPEEAPLIVVVGGSQGAVAMNQLVRQAAPDWLEAGAWLVHLTGENDPEADRLSHPHYIHRPFYDNMAALLQRADFAISRAGAGTLTELAITGTPAILIPYPFAAEDHQTYNAAVFAAAGAALVNRQSDLAVADLRDRVLTLLNNPERLAQMAQAAKDLAIFDSAERLAKLVRDVIDHRAQTSSKNFRTI
ncbi:MAG: undecaprenyldiphospho-muramoylpentapeptide beta-N-acetylglucosaminyltransferase [Leptolyngbyaceae cyanobacterium SM1_1_3]|nr:undecaprenyldiphospho-muramoylpentapeptide beta-N-acetylglucosaminyltransferase [Leptolyngbyaceae cyanobacterium SM1_1_3]NJN01693.1 undecaprenyldiphospho-muramoylpentapeptide beta-N-acetylglucosaminyltransferase [Leptolyngbyaceae cyanobacterium RM1_1_2]